MFANEVPTKNIASFYWSINDLFIEIVDSVHEEQRFILKIADDMFFMRRDQLEKLEETLEKSLYDESEWRCSLDERRMRAENEVERLHSEIERLEEIIEMGRFHG